MMFLNSYKNTLNTFEKTYFSVSSLEFKIEIMIAMILRKEFSK